MFTFYFMKRTQVTSSPLDGINYRTQFISFTHHATLYILRPYNFHMLKCITVYKPRSYFLFSPCPGNHFPMLFLNSTFIFLDSLQLRSYSICLSLTYFTYHKALQFHPCWHKWKNLFLFKWLSKIHMYIYIRSHCFNLFTCWQILKLSL